MSSLNVLSGGAAQGLFKALQFDFEKETGVQVDATFGAVGAMASLLKSGSPCDVTILTASLINELTSAGKLKFSNSRSLGYVSTGVAALVGETSPEISDSLTLKKTFEACTSLYVPHLIESTAGRHVASMLNSLGLRDLMSSRIREFPSGNIAMAGMVNDGQCGSLGCTQATEIITTSGVVWAGALPKPFDLVTDYHASITVAGSSNKHSVQFIEFITGTHSLLTRKKCGFEVSK